MFKTLIVAAMLLATPALAQRKEDVPPPSPDQPVQVEMKIKAVCMGSNELAEVMVGEGFGLLTNSKPNDKGLLFALWHNTNTHRLIGMQVATKQNIACTMFDVKDIEFTEESITAMFGRKT